MTQIKTRDFRVAKTHEILTDNGIYIDDSLTDCDYAEQYLRDVILEKNERLIVECQDYYQTEVFILDSKDDIDTIVNKVIDYVPEQSELFETAMELMDDDEGDDINQYIDEALEEYGSFAYATIVKDEDVEKLLEDDRLDTWEVA